MRSTVNKKFIAAILLISVIMPLAFVVPLGEAHAADVDTSQSGRRSIDTAVTSLETQRCSWAATIFLLKFNCLVLNIIWMLDKFLSGTVLAFATAVFDWSISYNLVDVAKSAFVQVGWGIVRDIANLFFIFILLWIALATIFSIQGYGAKDLLVQLIIAALLINFSLAIGGFFVNFTNALGRAFYAPIQNNLSDRLLSFTNIQVAATQPLSATDRRAVCERWANDVRSNKGAPIAHDPSYPQIFNSCMSDKTKAEQIAQDNAADPQIETAIYQALWLLIIIPIIAFVFLAGAIFFLIRYLMLSFLLIFAPIVFLFWILPATRSHWNDWWSKLIQWSFFAPAFFFLLFLTVTAFDQLSNANVGNIQLSQSERIEKTVIVKEPPLPKTASIGGLGTGLSQEEASASGHQSGTFQPKGFFGVGFDMVLFVALMIMNLTVAQKMGIMFAGSVIGVGSRVAGWTGRQVRGAAYRGAIRGAAPAAQEFMKTGVGQRMAQIPFIRGLTQPAVAIQAERERIDKERADRLQQAIGAMPADFAAQRLLGESRNVQEAFYKSARPEGLEKVMKGLIKGSDRSAAEREIIKVRNRDPKLAERIESSVKDLHLKVVASKGVTLGAPVAEDQRTTQDKQRYSAFQSATNAYLNEQNDQKLKQVLSAENMKIEQVSEYMIQNFGAREAKAVSRTTEQVRAFADILVKSVEKRKKAEFTQRVETLRAQGASETSSRFLAFQELAPQVIQNPSLQHWITSAPGIRALYKGIPIREGGRWGSEAAPQGGGAQPAGGGPQQTT